MHSNELVKIITDIHQLIETGDFDTLDYELSTLDFQRIHSTALLTYIRASYPVRSKLKSWDFIVDQFAQEFNNRNLDTKTLLRGII